MTHLTQNDVDTLRQFAEKAHLYRTNMDVSPILLLELLNAWEDTEDVVQEAVAQSYEESRRKVDDLEDEIQTLERDLAGAKNRIDELEEHVAAISGSQS